MVERRQEGSRVFDQNLDFNFFSHLTDYFGVCLNHIAINLQMDVQGLDLHL